MGPRMAEGGRELLCCGQHSPGGARGHQRVSWAVSDRGHLAPAVYQLYRALLSLTAALPLLPLHSRGLQLREAQRLAVGHTAADRNSAQGCRTAKPAPPPFPFLERPVSNSAFKASCSQLLCGQGGDPIHFTDGPAKGLEPTPVTQGVCGGAGAKPQTSPAHPSSALWVPKAAVGRPHPGELGVQARFCIRPC